MYQVLTGEVPFRAGDIPRVLLRHRRAPAQPPRERRPDLAIPAGADEVVMRALEKKRADRWQDMAELQRKLAAVEAPAALEPAAPPAPMRLPSGTHAPLRARAAMPKARARWRSRLPLVMGAAIVLGGAAFGYARHALLQAPGRIEIETEPLEAEIYVDGQKMADRSPMFLDASPGSYTVLVRSPGYAPLQRVLEMKPRAQDVAPFVLTPLAQAKAAPTPRPRSSGLAARKKPAAHAVNGVTFIDFKKAADEQRGR